jgi:hypothetical protein
VDGRLLQPIQVCITNRNGEERVKQGT